MTDNWISTLNRLSSRINDLYGFVQIEGDNFGEPAINSGPCAVFANAFFHSWNLRFEAKVHIAFVMVKHSDECWHTLIRLPNGMLFDGGVGVHDGSKYAHDRFTIEIMNTYDLNLLDKRAYGLNRDYPRYCPSFSLSKVNSIIDEYLDCISPGELSK